MSPAEDDMSAYMVNARNVRHGSQKSCMTLCTKNPKTCGNMVLVWRCKTFAINNIMQRNAVAFQKAISL